MTNKDKWLAWIAKNPIQAYLESECLSVQVVAKTIKVSRASVYFWLSGEKIPSARRLGDLERAGIATAQAYAAWWAEHPNPPKGKRSKSAIDKERIRKLLEEKSEYDPNTGCKIYCGAWKEDGKAQIRIGRRTYSVQMAALWVAGKVELYDRVYAYRTCRSLACCELGHIKVKKTVEEAMADMRKRGIIVPKKERGIYLTERRREAVRMLLEEGRTPEQIAEDTGVAVHLIKGIAKKWKRELVTA